MSHSRHKICVHPRLSAVNNKLIPTPISSSALLLPLLALLWLGARSDLLRLLLWCVAGAFRLFQRVLVKDVEE